MTEIVLDASVVLKWFAGRNEDREAEALAVRAAYEAGRIAVVVPTLLALEIVNIAARRWMWGEAAVVELAADLDDLGFEWREAEPERIARWTATGLTAYDAAYVALAEEVRAPLITDDRLILERAPAIARALTDWPPMEDEGARGGATRRRRR